MLKKNNFNCSVIFTVCVKGRVVMKEMLTM